MGGQFPGLAWILMVDLAGARKPWYRIRLWTVFRLFTLISCLLAWVAYERRESARQLKLALQLGDSITSLEYGGRWDLPFIGRPEQPAWRRLAGCLCGTRVVALSPRYSAESTELAGISGFRDLRSLIIMPRDESDLSGHVHRSTYDISFVSGCGQLQVVHIYQKPIDDLAPFAELSQLRRLFLAKTRLKDAAPLASLSGLRELDLCDSVSLVDVGFLAKLSQLELLNLRRTGVRDLAPIASLTQLTQLDLSGSPVSNLTPLIGLHRLTQLRLSSTLVTDVSPLSSLAQLEWLDLDNTSVQDFAPLRGLTQLRVLILERTSIDAAGVEQLRSSLPNCRLAVE